MPRHLVRALVSAAAILAAAPTAHALQVTPMVAQIEPGGSRSTHRISVKNTETTPTTIEIQAFRMTLDETGKPNYTPDTSDLLIFPPQTVIPPGREQLVQVRYTGAPTREPVMYLLKVAQLPISMGTSDTGGVGANIMLAFNMNTFLFVQPANAKPVVSASKPARGETGDLVFTIENTGTGVAQLRSANYVLRPAGGEPISIDSRDVELGEISALPPGASRRARIPAKLLKGATGDITASVELQ